MKTYQKTLVSILIGLIAFPIVALGGSFVVNLIQGKTPAEAVQILAEQLDSLIGRVEIVETNQDEQEQAVSELQNIIDHQKQTIENQQSLIDKEKICREVNELLVEIKETCGMTPFPGLDECITKRTNWYAETNNPFEIDTANRLKELKPQYLLLKQQCDSLSQ